MAASGGTIDSFAIYTFGDNNANSFWKNATLTNMGNVEIGYSLGTSGTFTPGVISDGSAADSTTARATTVNYGGGAGSAVILNVNNTYTGLSTINANGTARAQHANAFGTTAGGVSVTSGGMIELSGGITIGAEALTLNGSGVLSAGALRNTSGNNNWQANVTLGSDTRINSDSGTLTIDPATGNAIAGTFNLTLGGSGNVTINDPIATSTANLTKDGSGTLTLAASNSFTGGIILSGGTLSITNANALGGGQFNMGNAGTLVTLAVNANSVITNTFQVYNAAVNAVIDVASGVTNTISGRLTQDGAKTNTTKFGKAGAGTLIFNNVSSVYNGQIQIGNGSVILGVTNALGTNTSTTARGIDLGLNISDVSQTNSVSLLASNNVTVAQSIYVANNASGATRTIGISGSGTNTFSNEFYIDGILTVDAGSNAGDRVNVSGRIINTGGLNKTGAGSLVLTGTNTYSGGTLISAGTLRIGAGGTVGSVAGAITNNAALVFDRSDNTNDLGIISGSGWVNKLGAGTLTLTNAHTYSGGTLISAGTLSIGGGAVAGSVAGSITNNTTLVFNHTNNMTHAGVISGTGTVTKLGTGALTYTGENTYSGGTLISAGILYIGSGGSDGSIIGAITNNASLVFNRSGSLTIPGIISGSGTITNQGAGTVTLSGVNTFTNILTIASGTIQLGNAAGLGAVTARTTVSAGGTLDLNGLAVGAEPVTLNGSGVGGNGALVNNSGTAASLSGVVTMGTHSSIGGSGDLTLSAALVSSVGLTKAGGGKLTLTLDQTYTGGTLISGGTLSLGGTLAGAITNNAVLEFNNSANENIDGGVSGTGSVNKINAGQITFRTVASTYSGTTTISAGIIRPSAANLLSDNSAFIVNAGGTLDINNFADTIGSLAGAGNVFLGTAAGVSLTAGGDNSSTTFSGVMSESGGFIKQGTGTMTISGANTYTDPTRVQNGAMIYNGTNTASALSVASGAFLYGNGSIGALSVTGQVSAGSASNAVGNLRVTSITLTNNARIQVDMTDITGAAGTGWDVITASANFIAAGTTNIVIALKGSPANFITTNGYTNIIIDAATAQTTFATNKFTFVTDEFNDGVLGGGTFTVDALNNDLRIIFRPEPLPDIIVLGNAAVIPNNDQTPAAADHTDFGDVLIDGGTLSRTFTITNSGASTLGLGTITTSAVTGAASNFIVTAQPAASVAARATTTFTVQFNPSTSGVVTADLQFTNNVAGKTPFMFRIQGTGTYVEVAVSGLGANIADGDATPTTTDGTDFGSVALTGGTQTRTFVITNSGNRTMTISGGVTTSGTHAANFVVTTAPSGTIAPSGSTSFVVTFDPSTVGTRTATLSFNNTDDTFEDGLLETPFNFAIQGAGVAPSITTFPASISFSSMLGSLPSPSFQAFSITNNGLGTMNWTLSTNASWLSVSNVTGTAGSGAGQVHTAYVGIVAGMTAGTSNATITVTSTEATNSPQSIAVSWTIGAIPDPTAQTVTALGNQLVRLAWTKNASHDVMIVYATAAISTEPSQGTSYSVGSAIGSGRVIYKGTAASFEHVVPAGTAAHYKFYSINNNYYSPGVSANVTSGSFGTTEIVEPFGYTNGVSLGSLGGGNGWANSWSVGSGTWTIHSGMTAANVYPAASGYAVRLSNPGDGQSGGASRGITAVSTGSIYVAAVIRYGFDGASKWAGIDLMSGASTVAYIGKDYTQTARFGIEQGGVRNYDAGYGFNPGDGGTGASTNNQYLIIARYNFDTDVLNGIVYYKDTAVPATEPTSWNATLNSAVIASIDGIKLSAGSAAGGQIGDVYYDEVRVARSWTELMKLTQPVATSYVINQGTNVTDGQIVSGTYTVQFDFYDTVGLTNAASLPNFDIWNASGTRILTNQAFSTLVYSDNGRALKASNTSHSGASGSAVVLGVYTSRWTAANSNGVQISNSDALSNGTKTVFTVVDDDTTGPVHSGFTGMGRTLSGATFTNVEFTAGLAVTGLVTDTQSGVYGGSSNTWVLFRDNTSVASGSFTALFADGTAVSSNGQLTAAINASNFTISGSYTLRVFSVNFDIDRSGDAESTTTDIQFSVRAPTITVSTGTLAFSNLLETATSGNLTYTIAGTNLVGNISVTSPPPFEISTNASTGFGNSLVITQLAGVVSSRSLFVRFRPEVGGEVTLSTSILHTATGAITQTVTASGTVLDRPNAQTNSTANATTAFLGDTVTLRIDADQTWRSNNRSFATVFGRYDNADLTAGTVQGAGVDPGFTADLVAAATPQLTNTGIFYWALRVSYQAGNDFYYDSTRTTWADMSITLPSSSPLAITVSPLTAPTPVSIAPDGVNPATRMDITWTRWNSRNVLITYGTALPSASPVNGTTYSAGQTFGNQTVFAGGDAGTSTEITGLLPGTTYFVTLYSVNNGYYSTGATFAATATEMPRARNLNGAATPSQPSVIYLGDSAQAFAFDSWGVIESSWGQPFLWVRPANADLPGGTRFSGAGFTNINPKTVNSGTFSATGTWYWGMQMDYGGTYGSNFWYKSSSATWEQMSANGNGSTLSVIVSEIPAPSGQTAVTNGSSQVDLAWSKNAIGHNVMVVRKTSVQSWTEPTQGISYTNGAIIGSGVVVYNGSATTASATGLTPNTTFDFKFYSVNNNYYSTGVTAQASTPIGVQTGVTGSLSSATTTYNGSVTATASGGESTGAYQFRQNGGTGTASFSGSGNTSTVTIATFGTATIEVRKLGDSFYADSDWVTIGTVEATSRYFNDWEPTSNKTAYTTGNLTVYGITWTLTNAIADSGVANVKNGTRSARMAGTASTIFMTQDKLNGISNISFQVSRTSNKNDSSLQIQVSTNQGLTWVTNGILASTTRNTFSTYSTNVLVPGAARVRISAELGAAGDFVDIDDINLTDFPAEIALLGTNGSLIANGSVTPQTTDGTDFGVVFAPGSVSVTNVFRITNTGPAVLTVSGVSTSSAMGAANDFQIISWPAQVRAGTASNLTIRFNPGATGLRTALVTVVSTDLDEDSYTFVLQGTGGEPEIGVSGNGADIADGSATPSIANHTDFGSTNVVSGTIARTYTITNSGNFVLTNSTVSVGGTHAADFSVTAQPASIVAAGSSTTFTVTFDPSALGTRSATLSFGNNDTNESPFNFSIQGTGLAPEIDMQGNGQSIVNNDATPTTADHTDFGSVDFVFDTVTRTFTITNTGNSDLTLGSVTTSGTHAAEFAIIAQPAATVSASASTTFQVRFDPATNGLRTAVLTFTNNDPNENPYVFTVQGTGTSTPEIAVLGTNLAEIASGTTTTATGNGTDFGSQSALSGFVERTFFVTNSGSATLSITGVTTSGAHASDFIVQSFPASQSPFTAGNLVVRFDPITSGGRTAIVTIVNNDLNESSYTFTVTGTGLNTATVATATFSAITPFTALVGGNVTDDGGLTVTNRGIVFNTTGSPTIADNVINTNGGTTGLFSTSLTNLIPGQTYFYRAFAQNSLGTSYGGISNVTAACFDQVVTGLTITATNFYDFTAEWSALTGAQSYRVDVSTNATFSETPNPVNLFNFDFASPNFLNATTVDSAVTVSPVTVTSGVILTNVTTGSYFNLEPYIESASNWNASVASTAKAYRVTMVPIAGNSFTITGIHFHVYSETNGPSALSVNIGNSSATFTTNLAATNFLSFERAVTNISMWTNAVTILIQGWTNGSRATTGQGLLKLDEFRVSGFVTPLDPNVSGYSDRTVSGTSVNVTGLNHSVQYFIRVRAAGGGTCASANSATQSVVTPTPPTPPIMGPVSVSSVGTNTATLFGEIVSEERSPILSRGFAWGTSPDPTGNESVASGTTTGVFNQSRSAISSGSFIYYRAWASNALGKTYSTNGTFWTYSAPPGLQSAQNTEAFQFDAVWFPAIGATNYYIDVSTSSNFTSFVEGFEDRSTEGASLITVTNLDPVTVYFYRVRPENPAGLSGNSAVGSITTLPTVPNVFTYPPTDVQIVSAVVKGEVINNGGAAVTSRGILFGTNATPTVSDQVVYLGSGDGVFETTLSNLLPNVTYHSRAFASNSAGVGYGVVEDFTTLCFTNAPVLLPASPVGGNAFVGNWQAVPGAADYLVYVSTNPTFGGAGLRSGLMVSYNFDAASAPPFIGPNTIDSSFTGSAVSVSSGTLATNVTGQAAFTNSPYINSAGGWTNTTTASAKSYRFTIVPRPGEYITITNISFQMRVNRNGPRVVGVDIGNGATLFTSNTTANSFITLSRAVTNVVGVTNPVLMRIFGGWIPSTGSRTDGDGTGDFLLDTVQLRGSTGVDPSFITGYSGSMVLTNSIMVTGLTFNATYYMRVRAETDTGCLSIMSATQTITTAGQPTMSGFAIRGTGAGNGVTDGDVRFGTYTITGSLFEAVAGISVSNALAPRFVINNASGTITVATNFFTTPFTNGAIGPVVVTGTGATGIYENVALGNYTSRIFATTAGFGDPSATASVAFAVTDDDTAAPTLGGFSLPGGTNDYDFRNLTMAFTGTVTDASGFGTGYFLLRNSSGAVIQSNLLYSAGGSSVTGTMTAANMVCDNSYTVSVFVVDGDDDRPGDTLGATNLSAGVIYSVGGVGGESDFPTASNATVNAVFLSNANAQTLTDGTILNGGWSAGIWLSHPDSLYTNADTPSITVRSSGGENVINRMKLTNIFEFTYASGKTFMMTNDNMPAVSFSQVSLGTYQLLWSASNVSACIAVVQDRGVMANGTNVFTVIDDDTNAPTASGFQIAGGLRTVDVSVALSGFAITGLVQDATSGIGFTSAPPYALLLNTDGSVLASNHYNAGAQGSGLSSGATVTNWLSGAVLSCGNIYTVRVVVADADNDRAGDAATIATNVLSFTARGPGGTPPTASNLLINNTNALTATLLDSQIATGGWSVAMTISHGSLALATGTAPPTFSIRNSTGTVPYVAGSFGWSNSGGTSLSRTFTNTFIPAALTNLITTGSYSIVWSAETDGACYGVATNSGTVSPGTNTFTVNDDDATGPAFTGLRAGPATIGVNCPDVTRTNLTAGDIAIVALNQNTPADGFAFVNTVDIPSGTTINFTDAGWRSGALALRTGEGTITWRATNCIAVGTIIRWQANSNPAFSRGQLVSSNGTFSFPVNNGDQLLAYQGPATNPVFIYALNNSRSNATWDVDATADSSSALPAGLINGFSAIALPRVDHVALNTSIVVIAGMRTDVLSFISTRTNWISSAATGYNLNALPYTFPRLSNTVNSITDEQLRNGGWTITGLVQDAQSGLLATGDGAPRFALIGADGSTVLASNNFSVTFTNGTVASQRVNATAAALDFNLVYSGVSTVRVFAADADSDRVNDSASSTAPVELDVRDDDSDPPQIANFLINGKTLITDPNELSSAVISGQVRDVTSGIAFSSAPPSYVVFNALGVGVSTGTFINLPANDGGATNWLNIRTATLNLLGIADCGTYTVRVSVADADFDHPADRLQTNLSFVINVAGAGGAAPQASDFLVDNQAAGVATVTDGQLASGAWVSSLRVQHPEGLYTEQPFLPTFRVVNPSSAIVLEGDWDSVTEIEDTLFLTNNNHASVAYESTQLGIHRLSWFARNFGACFAQTGFVSVITGGTNTFNVNDDDAVGPVPVTNISWTASNWTNTTLITLTWSSNSFTDPSGVSTFRLLSNPAQSPGLTNGRALGASFSTVITNDTEGITTNWLFAIDDDNDRADDTAAGVSTAIVMQLDFTAPPAVSAVVAPSENGLPAGVEDELTQAIVNWAPASASEAVAAGAPVGRSLSPFKTYRVYYTENSLNDRWPDASDDYFDVADGFASLGNFAATNVLLTGLTPGTEYRFALAGVDTAGNVGPFANAAAAVRTRMLTITNIVINGQNAVELYWAGAGEANYDVIYADGMGFTNGIDGTWRLAGNVQTNFFVDSGAADRVAPSNLAHRMMRFYRVAPANAWVPSQDRDGVASSNVVAVANYQLQAGQNILGIGVLPMSNTMVNVFGLQRMPSQVAHVSPTLNTAIYIYRNSANFTTQPDWYNLVNDNGTNQWKYTTNGSDWVNANLLPAPLYDALGIDVPQATTLLVAGTPVIAPDPVVMTKAITTGQLNVVTFNFSAPVSIKDIPDLRTKPQSYFSLARADLILVLNNNTNPPAVSKVMYRNSNDNKFYYSTGGSAENHELAPGESIVIRTAPRSASMGPRTNFTVNLTPSSAVLNSLPQQTSKITNSISARPLVNRLEHTASTGSVELRGRINPNRLVTEYWFRLGTTTNYTYTSPVSTLPASNATVVVSNLMAETLSPGNYVYELVASNAMGVASATATFFAGCPPIVINNSTFPPLIQGSNYVTQLFASGGVSPYTYVLQSGSLQGLNLTTNGLIHGMTAASNINVTVRVTDAFGCLGSRLITLQR